ncbi:MAG: zf-HC2 domain-containing protein [Planctomycetes bacterium]|nr:zf-HC2 domain-containing protein [Planctomycetota bacterium]
MTTERPDENALEPELLSAYLDDALSAAERQRVEAALSADPALQGQLEALRKVRDTLRELPRAESPSSIALDLRRRLLAEGITQDGPGKAEAPALSHIKGGASGDTLTDEPLKHLAPRKSAWPMLIAAALMFAVAFLTIFLPRMLMDRNERGGSPLEVLQADTNAIPPAAKSESKSAETLDLMADAPSDQDIAAFIAQMPEADTFANLRGSQRANFDNSQFIAVQSANRNVNFSFFQFEASKLSKLATSTMDTSGPVEGFGAGGGGAAQPSEARKLNDERNRRHAEDEEAEKAVANTAKEAISEEKTQAELDDDAEAETSGLSGNPAQPHFGNTLVIEGPVTDVALALAQLNVDQLAALEASLRRDDMRLETHPEATKPEGADVWGKADPESPTDRGNGPAEGGLPLKGAADAKKSEAESDKYPRTGVKGESSPSAAPNEEAKAKPDDGGRGNTTARTKLEEKLDSTKPAPAPNEKASGDDGSKDSADAALLRRARTEDQKGEMREDEDVQAEPNAKDALPAVDPELLARLVKALKAQGKDRVRVVIPIKR